jgi:hypothetical protein
MKKTSIILISLVVVLFLGFVFRKEIGASLASLKLTPQKETFTELYFDDSDKLPDQTIQGKEETFSFTIHNMEGVSVEYPYVVYFTGPANPRAVLAQGSVTLEDNEYRSIPISHVFKATNQTGTIVVELLNLNQKITFLVTDKS